MTTTTSSAPRLKARYHDEIKGQLKEQLGLANVMQVPTVTKVVVNMGVGDAARDSKLIDGAVRDTGQPEAQLLYLPMLSRKASWTVLLDARTARPVGYLPLDAF